MKNILTIIAVAISFTLGACCTKKAPEGKCTMGKAGAKDSCCAKKK